MSNRTARVTALLESIIDDAVKDAMSRLIRHNRAVDDHIESIACIKRALIEDDYDTAVEAFYEIPDDDRILLSVASTKGGIYNLEDCKKFKDARWEEARKNYFGGEK